MTQYEKDNWRNLGTIADAMVKIAKQLEKQNEINEQMLEMMSRQRTKTNCQLAIEMMEDNTRG